MQKLDGFILMINPDEQVSLEEERRFLLESLVDLEREHAAGDIDEEDYRVLKNGYVHRAAQIIKVLDAGVDAREARPRASIKRKLGAIATVAIIAGAAGWFVAQQSGQRLPGQTISGGIEDSTASMLSQARALNFSDPKTAIDLYSKILALNPDHVEALTYRSWLIALVARDAPDDMKILAFAAATQGLDQAINVEPDYPDAHCFLGIVRFRLAGDAAGAKEQLDICAAMNPPAEVMGFVDSIRAEVDTALNQ
jgi:tetratricopeptide (TPR) repeat protein